MSLGDRTPIVVDATALIEYLFRTQVGAEVASIVEAPDADLHTPALCDVEIAAAIDRAAELRLAPQGRLRAVVGDYRDLPLTRHPHIGLIDRIVELGGAFESARATYVALGEALAATLLTADPELTRVARELLTLNVIGVRAPSQTTSSRKSQQIG